MKIIPITASYGDNDESNKPSLQQEVSNYSFLSSIKFLLILMSSLLILISVLVLSVIWISAFSSSVTELSSKVREEDFSKIVLFIERILETVVIVVETVKAQLQDNFDYTDAILIEKQSYRTYKVLKKYLEKVFVAVYIGYPDGSTFGMASVEGSALYYNSTIGMNQLYWNCTNLDTEFCNRGVEPDYILPEASSFVVDAIALNPKSAFTLLSYADPATPLYVFLSTVSAVVKENVDPLKKFTFFLGFDMSVSSLSNFLVDITSPVSGSVAFVIERETDFILASHDPHAVVATWDEDGTIRRKTPLNFGGMVTETAEIIYHSFGSLNKTFNDIKCNSKEELTTSLDFITVQRICTAEGIDWVLVFKVPKWNYVGSMVIAIISALIGAIIIVSSSGLMTIAFSLNIVRPFNNLIEAFEMVSNMELENLNLYKTRFSEVKSLQTHFRSMIEKIKLYRRFIPPHLLNQLDGNETNDTASVDDKALESSSSHSKQYVSSRSMASKIYANSNHSSSKLVGRATPINMFSLYMDKRKVTVVSIYLEGLNGILLQVSPNDCINMLSDLFEAVGQTARTNSGQLGKFENETLSVHFNATNDQANHPWKGINMSRMILSKMDAIRDSNIAKNSIFKSNPDLLKTFRFRIAVNCQNNLCGNVGSKQVMNFSILGTYQYNSEIMIAVAKQLELDIVISEEIYEQNNNLFEVRYVETKDMIQDDYYTSPILGNYESMIHKEKKIYELGQSNQVSDDEWMYELQEKEKKNRWKKYIAACEHYFESEYRLAFNLLQEHLQESKQTDLVAENLLSKLGKKISEECV